MSPRLTKMTYPYGTAMHGPVSGFAVDPTVSVVTTQPSVRVI